MLEDVECTTIGSYGVSGVVWHGTVRKNYVEHMSCHVTNDALSPRNSERNQHPTTYRAAWFGEFPVHAAYEIQVF